MTAGVQLTLKPAEEAIIAKTDELIESQVRIYLHYRNLDFRKIMKNWDNKKQDLAHYTDVSMNATVRVVAESAWKGFKGWSN